MAEAKLLLEGTDLVLITLERIAAIFLSAFFIGAVIFTLKCPESNINREYLHINRNECEPIDFVGLAFVQYRWQRFLLWQSS